MSIIVELLKLSCHFGITSH